MKSLESAAGSHGNKPPAAGEGRGGEGWPK